MSGPTDFATATRIEADIHGDLLALDARVVAAVGSHIEFKSARATVRGLIETLLLALEKKNAQLATAREDALEEAAQEVARCGFDANEPGMSIGFLAGEIRAMKKTKGGGHELF